MGSWTGSPGRAPATGRSRSRPTTVLCPQGKATDRAHPSGVENDHPGMVPRGCDAVQIPPMVMSERSRRAANAGQAAGLLTTGGPEIPT